MRSRSGSAEPSSRPRRGPRQRGSTYLVALLAMVVTLMVGVSLIFVTKTEMQVGANEGTVNRAFFATDSGVAEATARALTNADYGAKVFELPEPGGSPLLNLRNRVDASPFYPILDAPCNLCEINNVGSYSDRAYRKVNHAVTVTASRVGGDYDSPLGQDTVATMVEVQPWRLSPPEALLAVDDPTLLKKIRF